MNRPTVLVNERFRARVRGEFLEMPGLRLTPSEASRLFGLRTDVCADLLAALEDAKFLTRTASGAFIRFDNGRPRH